LTASEIMFVAIGAALVGRWANNKSTPLGPKQVIEAIFAVLFIGFLDQGKTEPIAKGFAWLFLAAVLLSDYSPLNALSKAENSKTATKAKVVTV
jgi:drug/metabolite transporter (DMT)-like permease